ncbi:ribosome maturation factor RimM [Paenibacillus aurantius]|uniref:Ribosome maturation factor RimM n=1 Tax=Paenibacillus aurantius TaxID=2918900 RepID=A0AA96RHS6_9BACL|nr:ribosome maturation factor RimM [Paenibacillus aurantius]WJH33245.1 ribosome maturation factor RimM [Paenibacillus sp. CC-CFT747]WNQ13708.1 ribosome maturation factor RimM [Paenibacillus aurantius]
MSGKLYNVGKIVNTHGIRGELKIVPQTDFPEVRFAKGSELVLLHPERDETLTVKVESGRPQKNVYLVKFAGMTDINEVEKYRNWLVKVKEEHLVELEEGEYYHHEIIGCRVITDEGEELGTITEILSPGANDVWVVSRPKGKQVLIPVIDDVLLNVDVPGKTVTVSLLEGLL